MKKLFSTLLVVFFATSLMAQTGLTCNDPIPVDNSYTAHVNADDELWYTAWTYDLPMHVYFSPDSMNSEFGPEVEIDFTCDYGNYSHDHKLDSVIKMLNVFGFTLPVAFACEEVVRNGKVEWDLSIDQKYRDQLTEYGLTHNVQAYVKVYFPEGGTISLTPDPTFQSCMENGHYTKLAEPVDIAANDTEKMVILPYSEWKEEDVRLVWTGEQPARVWVAEEECQFLPTDASVYVKAKYDIDKDTPQVITVADMQSAIKNWRGAGIFYAKVISEGPGQLIVERIPLGEIQGDAILLKHGEPVQLQANDNRVFCFPKTWKSTEFLANTQYLMGMHVSNTPDFAVGDENVIAKYPFSKDGSKRELQLSKGDIANLGTSATDDYLYVRFACNAATTLTPSLWNVSSCLENTILITSGETFVNSADAKTVYRMNYQDWANYDFAVNWGQTGTLSMYVASYCNFTNTDPEKLTTIVVPAKKTTEVLAEAVDSWASSIEADGFLYVLFGANRRGPITVTSAKPAETDPENPEPQPVYTTISETLCFGETYEWNGQSYDATGTYTQTFPAASGADSIVTLQLTVLPEIPVLTHEVTLCYGETYEWNGDTYNTTGEYEKTLQSVNGCDSMVVLNLTILPQVPEQNEKVAICYGESYTWQGQEYTESGSYSVVLQDENGCDYLLTLDLTVYPKTEATTEDVTIEFGQTYEWNGTVYDETGSYTITLQDANGCPYEATLNLVVLADPQSPCVAGSTELLPTDELTINLQSAFIIYRIDYQAWLEKGVSLTWTGDETLYTFVAETCTFALAQYNKYVARYEEVPSQGNVVLNKDILSSLAGKVDEDGYLYVRFLTEFEGVLTTAQAE